MTTITSIIVTLDFLEFPNSYTCKGEDRTPALNIKNLNATSVAIMVFNPFIKSCCSFTPWIVWNLPPLSRIPEGIPKEPQVTYPVQAVQGRNDYGTIGYQGPCPPEGEMHRYQFRVYGLDTMLDLPAGSTKDELIQAMKGHVVQYGETVALAR
ncbi:phospholipid-binding protein, PBP family [Methanospirillum hungatei JF-1]|jgi:Raf kinase inhibitor-like YbhB/YbcL family protein|uniref:Phospholipid-binding protein, PBP family n=1 Tax=Methanospirillum hungatei JF-1 (strain ATCC 27890 / DSM 864 / NBRC 100397 / JF-1) TaxID=323259 RepID=Q2FMZ5_METHJ|nr:YbhB/YbcL family Raf kinase inhibitor-like protein [Methanospirillum hungatei]ABD39911.1 phospholipid-binding protein, PBP family [Methanospirillum hungatei JF-1]